VAQLDGTFSLGTVNQLVSSTRSFGAQLLAWLAPAGMAPGTQPFSAQQLTGTWRQYARLLSAQLNNQHRCSAVFFGCFSCSAVPAVQWRNSCSVSATFSSSTIFSFQPGYFQHIFQQLSFVSCIFNSFLAHILLTYFQSASLRHCFQLSSCNILLFSARTCTGLAGYELLGTWLRLCTNILTYFRHISARLALSYFSIFRLYYFQLWLQYFNNFQLSCSAA
jgi:hypothetical protein